MQKVGSKWIAHSALKKRKKEKDFYICNFYQLGGEKNQKLIADWNTLYNNKNVSSGDGVLC